MKIEKRIKNEPFDMLSKKIVFLNRWITMDEIFTHIWKSNIFLLNSNCLYRSKNSSISLQHSIPLLPTQSHSNKLAPRHQCFSTTTLFSHEYVKSTWFLQANICWRHTLTSTVSYCSTIFSVSVSCPCTYLTTNPLRASPF